MLSDSRFLQQKYQKKLDILSTDSTKNSKLEASFTSDLLDFIQNCTNYIGETYFKLLDKIIFCKNGGIEINKSLLYDHIKSKEHTDIQVNFIRKCMTYCEKSVKETKNDIWRKHILSEEHLEHADKRYCEICKMTYYVSINSTDSQILYE